MASLMMIQPGAFGDIIICAPIAKAYADAGYEVIWPARKEYIPTLEKFSYVTPILLNDDVLDPDWLRSDVMKCLQIHKEMKIDYALNLADRGPHPTAELPDENFEQVKYRLANIPFAEKHNLVWNQNYDNEKCLYNLVIEAAGLSPGDEYALVHTVASNESLNFDTSKLDLPVIEVREISGYAILDWFLVVANATKIYCVESSIQCFIDGIVRRSEIVNIPKHILPRPSLGGEVIKQYTISEYWNPTHMEK